MSRGGRTCLRPRPVPLAVAPRLEDGGRRHLVDDRPAGGGPTTTGGQGAAGDDRAVALVAAFDGHVQDVTHLGHLGHHGPGSRSGLARQRQRQADDHHGGTRLGDDGRQPPVVLAVRLCPVQHGQGTGHASAVIGDGHADALAPEVDAEHTPRRCPPFAGRGLFDGAVHSATSARSGRPL